MAGDIANTLSGWDVALEAFRRLGILKLIVPGNHDIWIESKSALKRAQDSTWKYDVALPASADRHGFHCLPQHPVLVGDARFVGSFCWYDYSFRDERLEGVISTREYERGAFRSDIWNVLMVASLQRDLGQIPSKIAKVAVALHTSPFLSCIEPKQVPDFFDAYEGCTRVGEVLGRCATGRAVTVISGHRHKPLDVTEDRVRVVRSPVGYLNDFHGDYHAKAAEVIGLVEL